MAFARFERVERNGANNTSKDAFYVFNVFTSRKVFVSQTGPIVYILFIFILVQCSSTLDADRFAAAIKNDEVEVLCYTRYYLFPYRAIVDFLEHSTYI